jgi:signal peptide peptidase SppA
MEITRESLFTSAWRSFFKVFFGVFGFFLAIVPLFFLIAIFSSGGFPPPKNEIVFLPDANDSLEVSRSAPVILQLDIHGEIGRDGLTGDVLLSQLIESQKGMLKDKVKGILLHMNTPGGGVTETYNMYQLLLEYKAKYKVPVYAYVDGLCASGGMYITSAADKIYSAPISVIGSIGIISGPYFNVAQTMDKIGVLAKTFTEGKDKDSMNPFRPWTPDDETAMKPIITYLYNQFVTAFVKGHPKVDRQKLTDEYGAKVFDPITAQKIGYIDEGNKTYKETLKALVLASGIKESHAYQVVRLEPKSKWLSDLVKGKSSILSGKIEHELSLGSKKEKNEFFYLYQVDR